MHKAMTTAATATAIMTKVLVRTHRIHVVGAIAHHVGHAVHRVHAIVEAHCGHVALVRVEAVAKLALHTVRVRHRVSVSVPALIRLRLAIVRLLLGVWITVLLGLSVGLGDRVLYMVSVLQLVQLSLPFTLPSLHRRVSIAYLLRLGSL